MNCSAVVFYGEMYWSWRLMSRGGVHHKEDDMMLLRYLNNSNNRYGTQ